MVSNLNLDKEISDYLKHQENIAPNQKQFIILRGHQGAGKSTFANMLKQYYQINHPERHVAILERDDYYLNENNEYIWQADKQNEAEQFLQKRIDDNMEKHTDVIIIANTNITKSVVKKLQDKVNKYNKKSKKENRYQTQIFRLQNAFENVHNVPLNVVRSFKMNMQDIDGEIFVKPIDHPSNDLSRLDMPNRNALAFNKETNSHITQEYLNNFENILFTKKASKQYPELFVLKYRKSVFFDSDWDQALLEMRGTVVDKDNNIVIRPFKKVFNYSELVSQNFNQKGYLDKENIKMPKDNDLVYGVTKINGYLGNATYVSSLGKVIYSTTGSLDSDFVVMAEQHLNKYERMFKVLPDKTFAFEIIDESDPHIIKEELGEYFLGLIDVKTGYQFKEKELDMLAKVSSDMFNVEIKRPAATGLMTFKELKHQLENVKHEGFMVFNEEDELICKMKSPYYLVSKFIARIESMDKLEKKLAQGKEIFDEEYYPLLDYLNIPSNKEKLMALDEQGKLDMIQGFLVHQETMIKNEIEKVQVQQKPSSFKP